MLVKVARFSSARDAVDFAREARAAGWRVTLPDAAYPVTRASLCATLLGAVLGGLLFGTVGGLGELGLIRLRGLEPLFAAPLLGVVFLLAAAGASLGGLIAALVCLRPVPLLTPGQPYRVCIDGRGSCEAMDNLARRYGGSLDGQAGLQTEAAPPPSQREMTLPRWLAWGIAVATAAILLIAASYIWLVAFFRGPSSNQETRMGYTLKNAQRIPAETPASVGRVLSQIVGGPTLAVPEDPIAAAILAPVAASRNQTLVYGGAPASQEIEALAATALRALPDSRVLVVVPVEAPAYALPPAYAAAFFRAPVIPADSRGIPAPVRAALEGRRGLRIFLGGPDGLIPESVAAGLRRYGTVQRVASGDIYRHALLWARGRWDDFGWGINERFQRDGYPCFALANPETPDFAAAGLPLAYRGNNGPLLYTPRDRLDGLTEQYLWRLSPDYFVTPSEGPFINLRILGGPDAVSYSAQARADLASEVRAYRNQGAGMSGLALLGWAWFFIGLAGSIWALFAMPARLPETGFYPRLSWPLAILVLSPVGIIAFLLCYQGRPVSYDEGKPVYVRPLWARTLSATTMSLGAGLALMIAIFYLMQLNGLPLFTTFAGTRLFWLGSPLAAWMWALMVIPAFFLSTLLFTGPMMAEMAGTRYRGGVRLAAPVVALSLVTASLGMWTLVWYWMNFHPLMAEEDRWLWITPLWWGAALGFLTALIPNYLMERAGWKSGGT